MLKSFEIECCVCHAQEYIIRETIEYDAEIPVVVGFEFICVNCDNRETI